MQGIRQNPQTFQVTSTKVGMKLLSAHLVHTMQGAIWARLLWMTFFRESKRGKSCKVSDTN